MKWYYTFLFKIGVIEMHENLREVGSGVEQAVAKVDVDNFPASLGYQVVERNESSAVLELKLKPQHLNRAGIMHGGVISALLDIACAEAGLFCPDPERIRMAVTLSLTVTFTGQCGEGVVRAIGKKRAGGRRIFNSSGELFDQQGKLLAIAEGTFRLRSGFESPEGVLLSELNR